MKGIGGILSGIWALRPDLNLSRRYMENYGEVEGAHRLELIGLELIGWSSSGWRSFEAGLRRIVIGFCLECWILP